MLLSLVLSLLMNTNKSSILGLKVIDESNTPSIKLGTDILFIRLGEKALLKTLEGIIARLFIVVGLITRGMPIT